MTLSWSKLYNEKDDAEFDRLLPGASEGVQRSKKGASTFTTSIQTRETYTGKDLKKFNKMFSDGHAPIVTRASNSRVTPAHETPPSRHRIDDYSERDQALFEKINPSSQRAEQSAFSNGPGSKQAAPIYKDEDLKQFDALIAPVANSVEKSNSGGSTPIDQPTLRFPDLHTPSIRRDLGGLQIRPPGQRKIKMRYFD
ncbi:MAG: hypothetical protein P8M25_02350 [Paracoccaceae bacterium]|nr:hypothetical protein [Paracoccaceae bacterium]